MAKKGYTTELKIESFLNTTITTGAVDDYIEASENIIDNITGRNFIADTVAIARKYDGNESQDLVIDDCVEITKVELGSNYYGDSYSEISDGGSDGYYLFPTNYSALGYPINKIHLRSRIWIKGLANHRITAKWGYSASVPADIQFATTILASLMYKYGRSGAVGGVKSEKIGEYAVTYGTAEELDNLKKVDAILNQYKKYEL